MRMELVSKFPKIKQMSLQVKKGQFTFKPLGRAKMREWIQINRERSEDYLKDQEIFDFSIKFVSSLASKKN